jgi:hypothetical protein
MLHAPFDVAAGRSRANGVAEAVSGAAIHVLMGSKVADAGHMSGRVHGHMGE